MKQKRCFKCRKLKPVDLYYKHKQMADGYLNKCKICTKKDVKRRYYDPDVILKITAYERERAQTPARKANILIYQKRMRDRHPKKYRARGKISNGIRDGKIYREPCSICGDKNSEAHHTDYRSPLKVTWLCRKHHLEVEGKKNYSIS